MKQGLSIQELAKELDRQQEAKKDFIADSRTLSMADDGQLIMSNGIQHSFQGNKTFHAQVANRLGIPKPYYDRMRSEAPELLAKNVNNWMHEKGDKRLVRTLDGVARAFLSDRYRPLDNYNLAGAVLPVLQELGAKVVSSDITENKFYLKAIIPGRTELIAPEGYNLADLKFDGTMANKHILVDEVQPGLVISNSEVGLGGVMVSPAIHTIRCTNMASWKKDGINRSHIGGALGKLLAEGQDLVEYLQDDTRRATDEAIWKQVRDICRAACEGKLFEDLVDRLRESRGQKIEGDIPKVLEVTGNKFGLSGVEQSGILRHLIEGGELSKYGLSNAVTQYSQDAIVDYDRASELEEIGAELIELPQNDWRALSVAA